MSTPGIKLLIYAMLTTSYLHHLTDLRLYDLAHHRKLLPHSPGFRDSVIADINLILEAVQMYLPPLLSLVGTV